MRKKYKNFQKNIKSFHISSPYPSFDTTSLVQALNNKIADLDISNYNAYMLGDFNPNISMNIRSCVSQNYLHMLASNLMCPIITKPTKVTDTSSTIIDHVITNCSSLFILRRIINRDLTDHYPVFCSINHPLHTKPGKKCYHCLMKNFNPETFVTDFSNNLDHFNFSTPFSDMRELSAAFDNLIEIIETTINIHAPFKIASRKQRKILKKPWLIKGIQIFIRNRTLHQSFYVRGNAKQKLYYKEYANKLTKVKELSKLHLFQEFEYISNNNYKFWKKLNHLFSSKLSNFLQYA